jgi:hypothetical protein
LPRRRWPRSNRSPTPLTAPLRPQWIPPHERARAVSLTTSGACQLPLCPSPPPAPSPRLLAAGNSLLITPSLHGSV